MQSQVLYVVPITSTLGRISLVPDGDTGIILFTMSKESKDFDGASCDTKRALAKTVAGGTSTVLP
jgi:hypothetical protein